MPLPESRLTTSFRFGDAIADVANHLLGALDETVPLLGNPEMKSSVVNKPHTKMRVMRFYVAPMHVQWNCFFLASCKRR